ncbi:serine/threonine protein kinase [Apiospora marii]|uniref:serine/threonine protein kinase n=1 Tax=Apiospora marii TaxID=335849 RepID=UPI0031319B77
MSEKQTIDNNYIDRADLNKLLQTLFPNNSEITVKEGRFDYVMQGLPRRLTDSTMESLVEEIYRLRRENCHSRFFVPHDALMQVLSEDRVRDVLKDVLQAHSVEESMQNIFPNGRKVLGILIKIGKIHLITKFIKHDQLRLQHIDYRLPFSDADLAIILSEYEAMLFREAQWEFIAPTFSPFSIHRKFNCRTVMPFLEEKGNGNGSFGIVTHVTIDSAHQSFPDGSTEVVRKELIDEHDDTNGWQAEFEVMATLNLIDHPNILRMLGSYSYKNHQNFLFPKAEGGSLEAMFRKQKPTIFRDNWRFIAAVAGLASALSHVHNFAVRNHLNLSCIGCHHDIKPDNVLVSGDQFILADFGLARFKDSTQSSSTEYKVRKGLSIAPECQDLGGDFKKHRVGRPSDIWSFGCLLLEILTYMRGNTYQLYHCGTTPNPAVSEWGQGLRDNGDDATCGLVDLIEQMLCIEPKKRLKADEIEKRAIGLAIKAQAEDVLPLFQRLCSDQPGEHLFTDPFIEKIRFKSWFDSMGDYHSQQEDGRALSELAFNFSEFRSISSLMRQLKEQLLLATSSVSTSQQHPILPIRQLVTAIHDAGPALIYQKAQQLAEMELLRSGELARPKAVAPTHGRDNTHLLDLATAKAQMVLTEEESLPESVANAKDTQMQHRPNAEIGDIRYYSVGSVQDASGDQVKVLIEFKKYDDPRQSERLLGRMGQISRLCQSAKGSHAPGILNCRGFYHYEEHRAYGLVYDFPYVELGSSGTQGQTSAEQMGNPDALQDIMSKANLNEPFNLPSLKRRFEIAYEIAISLREVHKLGLAHKGLTSRNVIFFHGSRQAWETRPYLIGFRQTRPSDPNAFTEGPVNDPAAMNYQHPSYRSQETRYRLPYDYYSLGIVLLEIGMWRPLSKLTTSSGLSSEELRRKLLGVKIPMLAHTMGETYRALVHNCVGKDLFPDKDDGADSEHQQKFEERVVAPLSKLRRFE